MTRTLLASACFSLMGLLLAPAAFGAETGIGGVVLDTVGMPVEGVAVRIHGPQGAKETRTDSHGRYLFLALVPGSYAVEVRMADLTKELTQRTTVRLFKVTTFNIVLKMTVCPSQERLTCRPAVADSAAPPLQVRG